MPTLTQRVEPRFETLLWRLGPMAIPAMGSPNLPAKRSMASPLAGVVTTNLGHPRRERP